MPAGITAEMAKGFTHYMLKAVLSGRGDEIVELARTEMTRVRLMHGVGRDLVLPGLGPGIHEDAKGSSRLRVGGPANTSGGCNFRWSSNRHVRKHQREPAASTANVGRMQSAVSDCPDRRNAHDEIPSGTRKRRIASALLADLKARITFGHIFRKYQPVDPAGSKEPSEGLEF